NTSLAKAEVELVNMRDRYKVLRKAMSSITNYEFVIMDCGPSLSVLNQNALVYADNILIPVSCDYLSLVGVKQILQTLKRVNEMLLSPVSILGVVPTFYDMRTRISQESVNTLRAYFKERVLPAIRLNTRLREAPGHKKTIFEFDPDSRGAQDYRRLVKKIIEMCEAENTARQEEAALEQSGA
ncbi:MAG: ParA family protein, partial [Planctomycetota bacterium]